MNKMIALVFLVVGVAAPVFAGSVDIPEIGVSSAVGALSLLTGAVLVLRSRRRK